MGVRIVTTAFFTFALLLATGATALADGASVQRGTVTFATIGGAPTCIPFADVGALVCGFSGTVEFLVVITPSGNENSHFNVTNFTGFVIGGPAGCTAATCAFANASGLVVLHLGDQPSKPLILINHGPEGVPHRPLSD